MKRALWIAAAVVATLASGATGYYFGMGQGAEIIAYIAAGNQSYQLANTTRQLELIESGDVERLKASLLQQLSQQTIGVAFDPHLDANRARLLDTIARASKLKIVQDDTSEFGKHAAEARARIASVASKPQSP
jgi:hypothetical protein